jgi:hypothetical protein
MFRFSWNFAAEVIGQPGGLSAWLSLFLKQFYSYPCVGALVTAGLLTGIVACVQITAGRLAPAMATYFVSLLPIFSLVYFNTDMNYLTQGTVSYLMMLAFIILHAGMKTDRLRLPAAHLLLLTLFLTAGPVAALYAVTVCLLEWLNGNRRWYLYLSLPAAMFLIAEICLRLGCQGEYRMLLSPEYYFDPLISEWKLYVAWVVLPVAYVTAWFFRKKRNPSGMGSIALYAVQLLPLFLCLFLMGTRENRVMHINMEQDYYLRNGRWDMIVATFPGNGKGNLQTLNVLHLALAKRGELGDRMLDWQPHGVKAIMSDWDNTLPSAIALCDVYYHAGDMAVAQKLAFEGIVSSINYGNVRLMQRLVQTNIVFGAYAVAEKYIEQLEQTYAYRTWARQHRRFLYDDRAVEDDAELGEKRKGLVSERGYAVSNSVPKTLEQLAVNNPENPVPFQYLVALYLMNRDLKQFRRLLETYAKTPVWPSLSVVHQEAVVALEQNDLRFRIKNGVSTKVEQRFRAFENDMNTKINRKDFREIMAAGYGNTYWFYLVFEKQKS